MRDITALAKQFYQQYGGKALYGYGMFGQRWDSPERAWAQSHYPGIYPWKNPTRVAEIVKANPPWLSDCIGWLRLLCMYLPGLMEPGKISYAAAVKGAPWNNLYNNTAYPEIRTDMFDISANRARDTWGKQPIGSIPEPTPARAIAVFMEGHIGLYAGDGKVIEMTPPHLRMTTLQAREKGGKWTHWAYVPEKWLSWAENVTACLGKPAPQKPDPELAAACSFAIGDKVRIKVYGVPYYPGGAKIPDAPWLRGKVMTVNGLDKRGYPPVPCARLREISTWCACENLEKIEG